MNPCRGKQKNAKQTKIEINIVHGHCIYCGLMLFPGEGFGDYTVRPSEIACNEDHLNKYRRDQNVRISYDMDETFNAKRYNPELLEDK